MGSLLPYIHRPGSYSRLIHIRGFCSNAPPPEQPKKKDNSWNLESLQNELSGRMKELKSSLTPSLQKTQEITVDKANFWMRRYEIFVGISEVKRAQHRVIEAEQKFIESQDQRRDMQNQISELQNAVKTIHTELEKTFRGEDRYLVLVTQEHQVLKEEKQCLEAFKRLESAERDCFAILSNAVRDSHEKERAQTEKTKYWSIIGSIFGSLVGVIGSNINNRLRMQEIRDLVEKATSGEVLQEVYSNVSREFQALQGNFKSFSTDVDEFLKSTSTLSQSVVDKSPPPAPAPVPPQESLLKGLPDYSKKLVDMHSSIERIGHQTKSLQGTLHEVTKLSSIERVKLAQNLEKSLASFSEDSRRGFKEVLACEDSLQDKFKDIISFLLSQPWNAATQTNFKRFQDDVNNKARVNDAQSIPSSALGFSIALSIGGCAIYGAYKLLGF